MSNELTPHDPQYADIKMAAIVSVPMIGWNPHWGCATEAFRPFNIPIRLGYGAYWHQIMSNMLEDAIDDSLDCVVTLDYDSMFDALDVDRLIGQFANHPKIDALAALQCKRGLEETPLLTAHGQSELEITGDPFRVDTAHFGLTLFRMDALKRMPKPWFIGKPDENGSYRTLGRTDPDIAFWRNWEKAGNSAYVDPGCSIGHLQPMVSVFNEAMKPEHIHVNAWRKVKKDRRIAMLGPQEGDVA